MNKRYLGYFVGGVMALALALPALLGGHFAYAQEADVDTDDLSDYFGGTTGTAFATEAGLGSGDLVSTVASIINVILGFLGVIAVVIILFGGFKWMIAGGDKTKVDEARKWIFSGITGLVIILSAYAIASFVIDRISTAVSTAGTTTG